MNNIYKVIWSKAKNCYVVASEIAKSHTKSASGSEKMGGYGKRALLALAAASAIFCGGLVNVGAADTVHVDESSTPATAQEVYTKAAVDTALDKKADKDSVYTKADTYTKTEVDTELAKKADAANVYTKADTYTKTEVNTAVDKKADKDSVYTKAETYTKTEVNTALAGKANVGDSYTKAEADGKFATSTTLDTAKNELDGKITANTAKITANETAITNLNNKAATTDTTLTNLSGRMTTAESDIGTLKADVSTAKSDIGTLKADMTTAKSDIGTLTADVSTAKSDINTLKAKDTELTGKIEAEIANRITSDTALDNKIDAEIANRITSDTALDHKIDAEIANRITSDTALDNKINTEIQDRKDAIKATNDRTGGIARNLEGTQTTIEGIVKVDNQGNVKDVKGLSAETITTTGNADLKGNVILGTNTANTVTVNGNADFNAAVKMNNGLNVTNGETNLKKTTVDGDLTVTGTITTDKMIFGDKATNNYTEIDKGHITSKNDVLAGDATKKSSSMELDHSKLEVGVTDKDSNGHLTMTADQTSIKNSDLDGKNYSEIVADKDSVKTTVKDEKDNTTSTKSSATEIRNYAKDKDGNESSIVQTGKDITNTAEKGTITNTAKDIVNNATGDMKNDVGGKLTTTVAGQATENFNGGLNTTVNGAENHTVTGKQINTVGGGQENIISGGQINNITGDQTTTITGNKTETVTENVTEDYKKNLTTTVGGNEIHVVKGTKTETVEGKLTENFKGGQETNVTGDQTTNVSGTQTTTATDIKRNASSGMIDTIDNDYGTNTETKVAGKTTTDVSIKGTGEKGQYIRGANESRDYLIKGTLKNSETKTAEKTSTEITDGNGNTSATIQDVNNLAGSVTNGTETGVSGIHAKDNSVSIDSIVTDGNKYSVINQKKGSIQSTVVDGTNSTVILQDKDNVTIASSNGTVGIVGKDIVNNAQNTITNTAGTSITNQVNDSKVTTDANGTTFENNTPAVSDGGATTTKINGNQITTGRVNANELGVSDKDGANTADFSVEAGEGKGVNASAGNGTTTGSLDVTAEEVSSSVKDASGKGSTFKQRIDKIMMESKDVSIKAEETLTNEAKVITNKASEVINNEAVNINNTATGIITSKASEIKNQADKLISNKVGENTWENMENGKITTSIKDGAKQNLTQSNAAGTTQSTVDVGKSTVTIQNADGLVDVVTDGTNTSVQNQTASQIAAAVKDEAGNENASVANATTSANTIKSGSKANTVISTADGTSFINSEAAAPVTGASGAGTAVNTTIKGNTITTGKVTMDYAEVMKDLGVHGNAKVDQNLEVGGTSTLKGEVTMESNATVKKDLKVEGTTTTKTLKVTENAEIDGTLKVAKKATFEDSVSIAKDLSVGGDVTAKSYKVGDKTYIDANGIHANDQKITNVADGSISEGSKDAVNGGQLYGVKRDLEHQVDKVGANAAAMANLRPMEFDPSSKWNIAAAIGNYGSETAAALGAFYRPNDDVMVNLSTAFGTGENMVGGGVSVRLGKGGNKLSREENNALKDQVNDLTARMDALLSVLNPNMSKDFPDVPENHWAYEAVSRLAGNDIVQGYPDGEFHGERTMTRYEMAEIIYNALSRGAEAEKELVEEFKPELQAMAASEKATAEKAEG